MSIADHLPKIVIALALLGGVAVVASRIVGPSAHDSSNVNIPEFTQQAKRGASLYDDNCAACHGENAAGGQGGPPLIHDIYNPVHHGDGSFQRAAKRSVPRHHWNFGDMPPQPQISESQMSKIIFGAVPDNTI